MKTLATAFLLSISAACMAGGHDPWFRDWPRGASGQELLSEQVVEIPHSLFEYAEDLLRNKSFLRIGDAYLPGFSYKCQSPNTAYLIRALYERPTNGMFHVSRLGNDVLVRHYALGPKAHLRRSALVVCLDFIPNQVYVATGHAL